MLACGQLGGATPPCGLLVGKRWPQGAQVGSWWPPTSRPEIDLVGSDRRSAGAIGCVGAPGVGQ